MARNMSSLIRSICANYIDISTPYGTIAVCPTANAPTAAQIQAYFGCTLSYAQRILARYPTTYVSTDRRSVTTKQRNLARCAIANTPTQIGGFDFTPTTAVLTDWLTVLKKFVIKGSLDDAYLGQFITTGNWTTTNYGDLLLIAASPGFATPQTGATVRVYDARKVAMSLGYYFYQNTYGYGPTVFDSGLMGMCTNPNGSVYYFVGQKPDLASTIPGDLAAYLASLYGMSVSFFMAGQAYQGGYFGLPKNFTMIYDNGDYHYITALDEMKAGLSQLYTDMGSTPVVPDAWTSSTVSGDAIVTITADNIAASADCFKQWSSYKGQSEFENATPFSASGDTRKVSEIRSAVTKLNARRVFARGSTAGLDTVAGTVTCALSANNLIWSIGGVAVTGSDQDDIVSTVLDARRTGARFDSTSANNLVAGSGYSMALQSYMSDQISRVKAQTADLNHPRSYKAMDREYSDTSWLLSYGPTDGPEAARSFATAMALLSVGTN